VPKAETAEARKAESDPSGSAAAHAFWSGTISFGLVTVPVQLYAANRSGGVRMRMLSPEGAPLSRRYYCPVEEREVDWDEIVRGYEIADDEYVTVTDEELEALEPKKSQDIDLRAFVDASQIDPLYFERAYFLAPKGDSNKAYRLLAEAMERERQAGIATFVMRDKEYLVAILSENGILRAETLRFADEVRTPADLGLSARADADRRRVAEIEKEIEKLTAAHVNPALLRNERAERILSLIEKKRDRREDVVESDAELEEGEAVDLIAALKQSLTAGTGGPPPRRSKPERPSRAKGVYAAAGKARTVRTTERHAARRPKRGVRAARR
jgi:DNA end-binding protein Ku